MNRTDIQEHVDALRRHVRHKKCWTCDCLQGFLVQLQLDATEDVSDIINPLLIDASKMHSCLGCSPCPPGEDYSKYIRRTSGSSDTKR
ncbi:MAG: hypothetical protein C0404_08865 [Verrucomicrobia bacterium]|nr:hypothetical protein [Verrucomicrobiota bacterium]